MALAVGLARIHCPHRRGRVSSRSSRSPRAASGSRSALLWPACSACISPSRRCWGLALARHRLRLGAVLATLAVAVVVTAGTLSLRSGELGFIQEWFGPEPERPGQYAASWSQRLIYAYVGGRVFLDRPLLGTGWHGELPPRGVRALSARTHASASRTSRRATSRSSDGTLIPQQTYDQVLFELGLVGRRRRSSPPRCSRCGRRFGPDFAGPVRASGPSSRTCRPPGSRGSPARSRARRSSAARRSTAMFWLTLGVAAAAPAPRSGGVIAPRHDDRARDRAAERRRGRAARAPARPGAATARTRRPRRRRHAGRRRGVDGVHGRRARGLRPGASDAAARALRACRRRGDQGAARPDPRAAPGRPPHPHLEGRGDGTGRGSARGTRHGRAPSSTPTTVTS